MITAYEIVDEARSWLGVPFRHLGRDRRGVDCVGLPVVIGLALGILPAAFSTGVYGRLPTGELATRLRDHCMRLDRAMPGSLIIIRWQMAPSHVGICTGETLIHSYEARGKVIEHGYRGRWQAMTHSVWALPGVDYE